MPGKDEQDTVSWHDQSDTIRVAIVLAVVAIFQTSLWPGVGYLLLCSVASTVVIYAYCAKCPSKAKCAHVLPGKAAMAI